MVKGFSPGINREGEGGVSQGEVESARGRERVRESDQGGRVIFFSLSALEHPG